MTGVIDWTDDLLTHVDGIDTDHRKLFELANRVLVAGETSEGIASALGALSDYTKEHFSREENTMERSGYPGLSAQLVAHRDLLLELQYLGDRLSETGEQPNSARVVTFFRDWLCDHILNMDMKFAQFLREAAEAR